MSALGSPLKYEIRCSKIYREIGIVFGAFLGLNLLYWKTIPRIHTVHTYMIDMYCILYNAYNRTAIKSGKVNLQRNLMRIRMYIFFMVMWFYPRIIFERTFSAFRLLSVMDGISIYSHHYYCCCCCCYHLLSMHSSARYTHIAYIPSPICNLISEKL